MSLISLNKNLIKYEKKFKSLKTFEILETAINEVFKKKITYVCSFGAESAIILHMISKINHNLPIIFLNTMKLFSETIEYKGYLKVFFNLENIIEVFPSKLDIVNYDIKENLWSENPDRCCELRKVIPLENALKNFEAWISGRKGFQTKERKKKKMIELQNEKFLLSPLINWNKKDITDYFEDNKLPLHPLFNKGYSSIGCETCTSVPNSINNIRSGRWISFEKTECGIHKQR